MIVREKNRSFLTSKVGSTEFTFYKPKHAPNKYNSPHVLLLSFLILVLSFDKVGGKRSFMASFAHNKNK